MISVACREKRHDECALCTACSCHHGNAPADLKARYRRFRQQRLEQLERERAQATGGEPS